MSLSIPPKKYRFPISLISHTIWLYHRFNHSYRDVQEQLAYRVTIVSHGSCQVSCRLFKLGGSVFNNGAVCV